MKGVSIGEMERSDIDSQVDKILRGLGNPEPPVRLEDIRELLRLDRQYYSSTDDSVLREFVSKVKIGVRQLFMRPTLILDVVKKANVSAFWIPDGKRILLDKDLPEKKHRWAETHEIIHSITEWHKLFLFGDSSRELNPACHDQLEAEANYGAGQLLFLRNRFKHEARDLKFNLDSIKLLSTRFGNTMTSTLWRYVEQTGGDRPVVGLVTVHPHHLPKDHDPKLPCKHFIESPAFRRMFGCVAEVEIFEAMQQYCSKAKGGPLGSAEVILRDMDGNRHVFWFETFFNRYEALTLASHVKKMELMVSVA